MVFKKSSFLITFLLFWGLFFLISSQASAKKIVYIPLDDRPVSLTYPSQAIAASGYQVITPPEKFLSSYNREGRPEELWRWLTQNLTDASCLVISSDSLIYGGLVQSRTHHLAEKQIQERIEKLKELKNIAPKVKIYCYSSLLRTPKESHGNVEPPYYEKYGHYFYRLGELLDKREIFGPNYLDEMEIKNLTILIPPEYYEDWFARREKNLQAHYQLARLAKEKYFHFYAVGKDDQAPLSQTHLEVRKLLQNTADVSSAYFQIIPGIDQVGLLLMMRAINEDSWKQSYIYTIYAEGKGPLTMPLYSDQSVGDSVNIQINTVGAIVTTQLEKADLVLVVNTPTDGINKEAVHPENLAFSSPANRRLVEKIKELRTEKAIALADIAYANGADNGFMQELYKQDLIYSLTSYASWNTPDNSIGSALVFGLLAQNQSEEDRQKLLQANLLEDWYYQSNVRPDLTKELSNKGIDIYQLNTYRAETEKILMGKMLSFNKKLDNLVSSEFTATFPWERLFEIKVDFKEIKELKRKNAKNKAKQIF